MKAQDSLIWNLSINDAKALKSLRTIKSEVSNANNEWRNQVATMRQAGEYTNATSHKINGLSAAIKKQQEYVDKLSASLKLSKTNTDVQKIAYDQWSAKLRTGQIQLNRMTNELNNTKQSFIRYSTGILETSEKYKALQKSENAMIKALKSEGKETEAQARKKELLKKSSTSLLDQLNKEQKALIEMGKTGDKTSVTYLNQEERINKLRSSIAELNLVSDRYGLGLDTLRSKNEQLQKLNNSVFSNNKNSLSSYEAQRKELITLINVHKNLKEQYNSEVSYLNVLKNKYGANSDQYLKQANNVAKLSVKMSELSNKTKSLNENVSTTYKPLDRLIAKAEMSEKTLQSVSQSATRMSRGLMYASQGIFGMIATGVKKTFDMEKSLNKTQNLLETSNTETTKVIKGNMSELSKQAQKLSLEYGESQSKILGAAQTLVKRGYSSNEMIGALKPLLQAAKASGDDLNDVIRVSTSSLESFGLRTDDTNKMLNRTTKTVNDLAYASDLSSANFEDIGTAMSYVGSTSKTAGISMAETAGAVSVLSNNGLEASVAGTGLRKVINSLISPTSKGAQLLANMNVELLDSHNKIRPLPDLINQLHDKMSGLSKVEKMDMLHTIFGTTGQQAASTLVNNSKELDRFTDKVKQANKLDYVSKLSKKNMDNPVEQLNRLKAAYDNLTISLGKTFSPMASKGMKDLTSVLSHLTSASPDVQKITVGLAVGIPSLGILLGLVGKIAGGYTATLKAMRNVHNYFNSDSKSDVKEIELTTSEIAKQVSEIQSVANAWGQASKNLSEYNTLNSGGTSGSGTYYETNAKNKSRQNKTNKPALEKSPNLKNGKTLEKEIEKDGKKLPKRNVLGTFKKTAGAGILISGVTAGASLVGTDKSDMGENLGGSLGQVGGTTLGGLAGSVAGPIGTVIGETAGGIIGDKVGSKLGKYIQDHKPSKELQKNDPYNDHKKTKHPTLKDENKKTLTYSEDAKYTGAFQATVENNRSNTAKSQRENAEIQHNYSNTIINKDSRSDQSNEDSFGMTIGLMDKNSKQYLTDVRNHEQEALSTFGDDSKNIFKQIIDDVQKYNNQQINKVKKTQQDLVKRGIITQNQANSESSNYANGKNTKVKAIQNQINLINSNESISAKKRAKLISDLNIQLVAMTDTGSKKQQKIQKLLNDRTTKMTNEQYLSIINQSKTARDATIKNAEKTKNANIQTAKDNYKKVKSEIEDAKLSKTAKEQALKNAKNQYEKSVQSAKDQCSDVVEYAKNQRKEVVRNARKQAAGVSSTIINAGDNTQKQLEAILGNPNLHKYFSLQSHKTPDASEVVTNNQKGLNNLKSGKVKVYSQKEWKKKQLDAGFNPIGSVFDGHLKGGHIKKTQLALVNEHGTESAYDPKKNRFRLLGKGPSVTKLFAGEYVLNAKQTAKLFNGGLGKNKVLKGYSNGSSDVDVKGENLSISLKNINTLLKFKDKSKKTWKDIKSDTKDSVDDIHKHSTSKIGDTKNGVLKSFDGIHKGIKSTTAATVNDFNSIFKKLPEYSRNSVKSSIQELNHGIGGINATLGQFGSSHDVLKPIHYAGGSNGSVTREHMAIVNDAKNGPEQEAIVRKDGIFLPKKRNALIKLNAGDQVLNGGQTRDFTRGIGLARYEKGTGVSSDTLKKLILENAKHTNNAVKHDFNSKINVKNGSPLQKGLTNYENNKLHNPVNSWYNAIWNVLSDAMGAGGSNSKFLDYAKKMFSGKPYLLGGNGPTYYDCSAMVAAALKHFGIDAGRTTVAMQGSSQLEKIGKDISKTRAGDIALFGHGTDAKGHVGIVDNPEKETIFNETPPKARVTPLSYITALPLDAFYRVKGLKDDNKNSKVNKKLYNLAKGQLGKDRLKWVKKNLSDSEDYGSGPIPTGDHAHLLDKAGIPRKDWPSFNYIIEHESTWNPKARNPSGAYGLGQAKPAEKMAKFGSDWRTNPLTQLKWMKSYVNRYGGAKGAENFWRSHHWYENGGLVDHHQIAELGEHNKPEMVLPLTNKSRTVQLAKQALSYVNKNDTRHSENPNNKEVEQIKRILKKQEQQNNKMIKILSIISSNMSNPVPAVVADKDIIKALSKHEKQTRLSASLRRGDPLGI